MLVLSRLDCLQLSLTSGTSNKALARIRGDADAETIPLAADTYNTTIIHLIFGDKAKKKLELPVATDKYNCYVQGGCNDFLPALGSQLRSTSDVVA